MVSHDTILSLLSDFGLWIIGAVALVEGPVVTVLSGALAQQGVFPLWPLAMILLAGDVLGDLLHYMLGRYGLARIPHHWRLRVRLGPEKLSQLVGLFDRAGGRMLVLAKLTHSAGAVVLAAAGLARMPLLPFLLWNTLAAMPKTAALMALGWFAGDAWAQIELWLNWGPIAGLALLGLAGFALWVRRKPCPQP